MKALSIKQPWSSLIAHGIKDIENRTWKTNFRGRIYIHASGVYAKGGFSLINSEQRVLANMCESWKPLYLDDLHKSAIIGEVDIVDCVINHESIWAEKTPFCPVTGLERFFDITDVSGKLVQTYGGPFDSYTIPIPDPDDPNEFTRTRFCHDRGEWRGDEMISKVTGIPKDRKPIYNWVLANAVHYDKPILNVKGKLSFWDFESKNNKL